MARGHWLKNYMKWYFDPTIESGGGGGEKQKILFFSNPSFNFSNNGNSPIKWGVGGAATENIWIDDSSVFSVEIDGEEVVSGTVKSESSDNNKYSLGIANPADTASVEAGYNAGVQFSTNKTTPASGEGPNSLYYAFGVGVFAINSNVISAGTHDVKVYKIV